MPSKPEEPPSHHLPSIGYDAITPPQVQARLHSNKNGSLELTIPTKYIDKYDLKKDDVFAVIGRRSKGVLSINYYKQYEVPVKYKKPEHDPKNRLTCGMGGKIREEDLNLDEIYAVKAREHHSTRNMDLTIPKDIVDWYKICEGDRFIVDGYKMFGQVVLTYERIYSIVDVKNKIKNMHNFDK
jgi:hypothetical protein